MSAMNRIFVTLLLSILAYSTTFASVKKYYITCDPIDLQQIYNNPEEDIYIPITLEYNGQTWTDVEMRIRGDGSRLDPKKSLKVKFNGDAFANGREKLNFNAEYLDVTYTSSYLSARVFREVGVPVIDIEHAALYVNNKFYGLYLRIENVDEQYLEARDMDVNGNLYKATLDGASLSRSDQCDLHWEKKTNTNNSFDDLFALRDSANTVPSSDFKRFLQNNFDYKNIIDIVAVNILISNASTYYHNYYLYHDINGTGKWIYMPWDMDKTFSHQGYGKDYTYTSHPIREDNPLIEKCFINDEVFADVKARVQEISNTVMNEDNLSPILDSLKADIQDYVLMDDTDQIEGMEDWEKALGNFKKYFKERINILNDMFNKEPEPFEVFTTPKDVYDEYTVNWEASTSPLGEVSYKLYLHTERNIVDGNALIIDNIKDTHYTFKNLEDGETYYFMVVAEADGKERIGTDDHNFFTYHTTTKLPCEINEDMTLTKEGGPYSIECDVTINPNTILNIEPETVIVVAGQYTINILGEIKTLVGNFISILPKNHEISFDINFANSKHINISNIQFENCRIKIADATLDFNTCRFVISDPVFNSQIISAESGAQVNYYNCEFLGNYSGEGIIYKNSNGNIEETTFSKINDAIEYHDKSGGNIINCSIYDSKDDGIDLNGAENVIIANCHLAKINDKAISIGHLENTPSTGIEISYTIVEGAKYGVAIKDASTVEVSNLDIINCETAFSTYNALGLGPTKVKISNVILFNNENDILNDNNSKITLNYSLSNKEEYTGTGNIKADPMFSDYLNKNYRLLANSPAIDAGDPTSDKDKDGTRADMGAFPFNQLSANIVINEIHYNQDDILVSGDWVELYNNSDQDIDLSDWYFSDSDDTHKFVLPKGTVLKDKEYLVLVETGSDFTVSYPKVSNYIGNMGFGLAGGGELIRLYNASGVLIDMVEYDDKDPWPAAADGDGYTLSLIDPNFDNALPESWEASEQLYGTPGKSNTDTNVYGNPPEVPSFKVYPLPANNYLTVEYNSSSNVESYHLYDIFGNSILQKNAKISDGKIRFDVSNLCSGSYYFIVRLNDDSSLKSRFIISK